MNEANGLFIQKEYGLIGIMHSFLALWGSEVVIIAKGAILEIVKCSFICIVSAKSGEGKLEWKNRDSFNIVSRDI